MGMYAMSNYRRTQHFDETLMQGHVAAAHAPTSALAVLAWISVVERRHA